jgi:hypothetical protein
MPDLEFRASQYWGLLITPTGLSPRCSAFVVALLNLAYALSDAHKPCIPTNNTDASVMPEHFSLVVRMLGLDDPFFGPPEAIQRFGHNLFDTMFAKYYDAYGIPIFWTTRPGSDHKNMLPMIRRVDVKAWVWNNLRGFPEDNHKSINKILNEMGHVLRDPVTDDLFEFKFIPKSCVPADWDREVARRTTAAYEQFNAAAEQLIASARPEEESVANLMQRNQLNFQRQQLQMQMNMNQNRLALQAVSNMAEIQKRGALIMNGGWTKDEWGNDKYVESSIF